MVPAAEPGPVAAAVEPLVHGAVCAITAVPMQLGAAGVDVECLQAVLNAAGFLAGGSTGTFDDATDMAVRELQTQRGLVVDGIVGRITASALGIWPAA